MEKITSRSMENTKLLGQWKILKFKVNLNYKTSRSIYTIELQDQFKI